MSYQKTKKCDYTQYGFQACGTEVQWNKDKGKFFEVESKEQHTKERCKEASKKNPKTDAKHALDTFNKEFPKENEHNKKMEAGISTSIEFHTQSILLLRDIIRMAKGEEVEQILAEKDEKIAQLEESLRLKSFEKGSNLQQGLDEV